MTPKVAREKEGVTMKANHRHFMVAVDLHEAKQNVTKALEEVQGGATLTASTHIRLAIQKLAEAQEELAKKGLKP